MSAGPLTLGTAGHVDHGKTTLVHALTRTWTDRLPEERERGLTIVLGYAALRLPSGRRLSLVDVPGHERFVRTMVAGSTGVDLFLLVVAADDGVMPQTVEHVAVLRALGVRRGVVAVTKADAADPGRAAAEAAELVPGVPVVPCSARTGAGLDALLAALDEAATGAASRAAAGGDVVLHVDRAFTVAGRGTVVTGTLWSGAIAHDDRLALLPSGAPVRVRGLEVHDEAVERAAAGQRVAVNLAGVRARDVARGDVLAAPGVLAERTTLDCALALDPQEHGRRAQVHHGTRDVAARLAHLDEDLWQLRLERPVLARDGDRVVVRRHAPPDTLGGGVVLDAAAARHGRGTAVLARLRALRDGGTPPPAPPAPNVHRTPSAGRCDERPAIPAAAAEAVEARLREAGLALLAEDRAGDADALRALRDAGTAVRVSGRLYAHADVLAAARAQVLALIDAQGPIALAEVRDALGTSRRTAQALLEHLDAARVTRRLPDDRRVLRRAAHTKEPA